MGDGLSTKSIPCKWRGMAMLERYRAEREERQARDWGEGSKKWRKCRTIGDRVRNVAVISHKLSSATKIRMCRVNATVEERRKKYTVPYMHSLFFVITYQRCRHQHPFQL